jgi:cell division septation protein DedD
VQDRETNVDAQEPIPEALTVEDKPVRTTSEKPAQTKANGYTVQVASVRSVQQADLTLKKLTDRGYAAYTVQTTIGHDTWYRIRIGYFDRPEATHELMVRLRSDQFEPIMIKF